MSAPKILFVLIGIFIVILAIAILFSFQIRMQLESGGQALFKTYENAEYGIAFEYPARYVLEEKEVGNAQQSHFAIILTEAAISTTTASEGPTAITFDIYQNNIDNVSVQKWVTDNNTSNFNLALGPVATTTVVGKEALAYTWDGLYRGDSVVFAHNTNIVMSSVTYMTPEDQIRKDFSSVLQSLRLTAAASTDAHTKVIQYLKQHISELSPVKETLGGKFYLTQVKFDTTRNTGEVSYEDGHNYYVASFAYSVDANGTVAISAFKLIEQKG